MRPDISMPPPPGESSDSLVVRTLLAAARQRPGLDERRCRLVLDWLKTGDAMRAALRKALDRCCLSELRFTILVVLFTLDPGPARATDLAYHVGVARSAVTDALDGLERQRLVMRRRDPSDRRIIEIRLTSTGRRAADNALQLYLQTAGGLAGLVEHDGQRPIARIQSRPGAGSPA